MASTGRAFLSIHVHFVCTVQKNAWMDEPTYSAESILNQFLLSNQPTCLLMDSCAVHETAATKEDLGNHGTKALKSKGALQVAFKFSTLASTNRSSTTCNNSLRILCYPMVKKIERLHIIPLVIGNHTEHVEVNRLLKK